MATRQCIRHRMPDGTIMNGPPHGPGQQCVEWSNGRGYNKGGLLRGPKHEQGGIPARLQGGGNVELEGGEYIVNAQTVNAVGTHFLDKLNSTATTHHQGGFQKKQLPSPSQYKRGGTVMPRRKRRMAKGGQARKRNVAKGGRSRKIQSRNGGRLRMQMGGRTDCPAGQYRQGGRCVPSGGYNAGGRINESRRRKMQVGGLTVKPGDCIKYLTSDGAVGRGPIPPGAHCIDRY